MTEDPTVRTYRGQVYRRVGSERYLTKRSREVIRLEIWQSRCLKCGAPFRFKRSARTKTFSPNRHCDVHKRRQRTPGR
jgi:hypothetical protein